jgi:O-antigen ligase
MSLTWEAVKRLGARNVLSTAILLCVVALAPLPFGSNDYTTIAFWCLLLGAAVVLSSPGDLQTRHVWMIGGLFVIVACYAFVLREQLAEHPWIASFHPVWKQASDALGETLRPSVSIVRNEPFFALGATLANVMALLLGIVVGVDRRRARLIMLVIAGSGAIYALYGVLSFLIEPGMILWREKKHYLGSVTGTFINRNSAATYFGSCSVIWLLYLVQKLRRRIPRRRLIWRQLLQDIPPLARRDILLPACALLVCLMALLMTGSRAGVALSLLALIVAFTIFMRRDLPPRTGIWISLITGAVIALGLLQLFGGRVSSRFDSQGLVDEGRVEAWRSTLRIIADYPWFGTGLGTFTWAFPPYRSPNISIRGVWDAAHSTPLELASEVGLPLAGIVILGWFIMQFVLWSGARRRRRSEAMLPLAALAISTLAMLHSLVDFSLQIPGYTIPFFALFGAAMAQALDVNTGHHEQNYTNERATPHGVESVRSKKF